MPPPPLAALGTRLRPADPRSDADLLDRFTATGDEAAFAELVRRYGGLVWAVCRRLTPDRHAAEDAFQATFLVLVRRAGAVRRASLAGFLHGVARKVSYRCRHRAAELPVEVTDGSADPLASAARREEAAALHAELDRLPGCYREALLLCDLGELSREAAAARLGWTEGSVKGRLERGRKRLAARLAKRGIVGGLTAAAAAVPAELAASVGRSAVAVWLGGPAAVPAGLAGLVRAATPWAAGKLTAGGLLAAGLATAVIAVASPADPPADPPPAAAAKPAVPADGKSDAVAVLRGAAAALDASKANAMIRNRFGSELADLFRRAGDRAAARDRLAKAKAAADTTGESTAQGKYAEWRWLARVYAKLGDADMVLKLADAAPDKDPWSARDQVLLDATGAAAGVGETAAVARLAEASSHPEVRTWSAASTRQLAVTRLARTDLPAALRAVDSVADPGDRVCALAGSVVLNLWGTDLRDERWWPGGAMETFGVARTRKKFGDPAGGRDALARAVALLPTVSAEQRPRADLGVIHSAAILGDLPTCRRLVAALPPQKLTDAQKRQRVDGLAEAKAKGYLAAAETAAGNDAAGLKLVDGLATTDQKENVLLAVAIARWHAGRRESAVDVFEQVARLWVAESYPQVQNLIDARGRVGDIAGAKRVAADALARLVADRKKSGHYHGDDAWHREQVARSVRWWETIAFHQFRHGDIDGARATAAEYLKSDMWAGEAAGRVAEQQARTGKAADARKEADAEPDPLRRAYMLAGLARGLLGDPD